MELIGEREEEEEEVEAGVMDACTDGRRARLIGACVCERARNFNCTYFKGQ